MADETFKQKVDAAVAATPHRSERVLAVEAAADMLTGDIARALGDAPPAPPPETAPPPPGLAVPEWTGSDLAEVHARRTDDDYFEILDSMQQLAAAGGEEVFRALDGNPRVFVETYDAIKAKFDKRRVARIDPTTIENPVTRATFERMLEAKAKGPAPEPSGPAPDEGHQERLRLLGQKARANESGSSDAAAALLAEMFPEFRK